MIFRGRLGEFVKQHPGQIFEQIIWVLHEHDDLQKRCGWWEDDLEASKRVDSHDLEVLNSYMTYVINNRLFQELA